MSQASIRHIRQRAGELKSLGRTPLQTFRVLRRENPSAERDTLVDAAGLAGGRTGYMQRWATKIGDDGKLHASGGFSVSIRRDPRKLTGAPAVITERKVIAVDYPLITIEAKDIRKNDWVEGEGLATSVAYYSTFIFVTTKKDGKLYEPREHVKVRLEDHGQT